MTKYLYTIQLSERGHNSLRYLRAVDLLNTMRHELSMGVADCFISSPQRNGPYYIMFHYEGHRKIFVMILENMKVQYRLQKGIPRLIHVPLEIEDGTPAPFSRKSEVVLGLHECSLEMLRLARGGL